MPIAELGEDHHRPERFLGVDLHVAAAAFEQRRLKHRTLATPACQQRRAARHRAVDPALEPLCFLGRDHRADEGIARLGIAGDQHFNLGGQHVAEGFVDALVDNHALHVDARLA